MTPTRREILEQVARGELSPEDADELLHASREDAGPAATPQTPSVRAVQIKASFGAIVVTGDESVAEAEIDGPHSAAVEGDVLVVRVDVEPDAPGAFEMHRGRRRSVSIGPGFVRFARGHGRGHHATSLHVRMNPTLALETKMDAGSLSINRIHAPIRARVAAGPITIEDVTHPLDVSVNAGAIRVVGKLTEGESRVRSDAGAVRIDLDPSSSVRIVADAALGKVVLPGSDEGERRRFGSRVEATIGAGEATLRVETAMGSINVTTF
jgi:hypothetical protein